MGDNILHKQVIVLTSNFSNPLLRRRDHIHCLLLKHHNIILGTFITWARQVVRENPREIEGRESKKKKKNYNN